MCSDLSSLSIFFINYSLHFYLKSLLVSFYWISLDKSFHNLTWGIVNDKLLSLVLWPWQTMSTLHIYEGAVLWNILYILFIIHSMIIHSVFYIKTFHLSKIDTWLGTPPLRAPYHSGASDNISEHFFIHIFIFYFLFF